MVKLDSCGVSRLLLHTQEPHSQRPLFYLLASSEKVKWRTNPNMIALISANAQRYPIQLLGPPENENRLPHDPSAAAGTEVRLAYRSGLYSSASEPHMATERLMFKMAMSESMEYKEDNMRIALTDRNGAAFRQMNIVDQ